MQAFLERLTELPYLVKPKASTTLRWLAGLPTSPFVKVISNIVIIARS